MTSGSLTTLKSTVASIGLHVVFLAVGSIAVYQNSIQTLELTGASRGGNTISLAGFSSGSKKSVGTPKVSTTPVRTETSTSGKTASQESSIAQTSSATGTGSGSSAGTVSDGSGNGNAVSSGDADNGALFSQIKSFFENRLGSTLKIRETQLIKIKVFLNADGEVQDATLAQGVLEGSLLRRVLSVAKNIPFKSYWKSGSFPKELIFPIVLTPQ